MTWFVSDEMLARTDRLELPFNRHGIDPYGVKKTDVALMMTVFAWLCRNYFTIAIHGVDHVPDRGRAMLVGNHSGGFAIDGMVALLAVFLEKDPPRLAQGMADRFINKLPFASLYSSRTGNFTGTPENAVRLLEDERLLMVFPEGHRGTAKLYGDRNTLVQFGTGFMRLALQTGAPIVPFAFLGGGDAVPTVVNLYKLGKLFGVPYIPITRYILPIPRPVPLEVYFAEPMHFEGTGNEEDHVIMDYVEQVKDRIATMIEAGEIARRQRSASPTRDTARGPGDRSPEPRSPEPRSPEPRSPEPRSTEPRPPGPVAEDER